MHGADAGQGLGRSSFDFKSALFPPYQAYKTTAVARSIFLKIINPSLSDTFVKYNKKKKLFLEK